jgi:hypothetical protein
MFSFLNKKKEIDIIISNNYKEIVNNVRLFGYAIVKICESNDLIDFEKKSNELISQIPQNNLNSFLALGRINDANIRNSSTKLIQKFISPHLKIYFNEIDFDIISGIHLLKPKGKMGILNPHQDSSLVNEELFDSYYFWMPISEIDSKSGTLEIIPKSHLLEIPFRSLNIPWDLESKIKFLWKYMQKIVVPNGSAIVFHSRLIHGSGQNQTNQLRIAINSFIKPKKADFLHYYSDKSSDFKKIEIFKVSPDFFYEENITERPNGKYELYNEIENRNKKYDKSTLNKLFSFHEEINGIDN